MNIYEKIQAVKEFILKANLKKSGYNKYSNYDYYELADFLPTIVACCTKQKLHTAITFDNDKASLVITNSEKPDEQLTYTSPMRNLELKGCNEIQALGGVETYQRRYLYMSAFDIVENDMFDRVSPEQNTEIKQPKQEATLEQAESFSLKFGKYKGKTLKEITTEDTDYANWLYKNGDDEIKNLLNKILEAKKEKEFIDEPQVNMEDFEPQDDLKLPWEE
jgi:hypothetical protein